ncbi:MAG TPA: NAD-dependent epimerase/dehydratase family protein [Opitutaceae bacterium]|jgi:UDP-glucuronate 4-epimerase|nr:NAD-dependent epimerase/dehydratase family protein [Opitutaceae bacterium]
MKILVTGAAGFIGFHVCQRLASTQRCEVLGLDNLGDYYSVELKRARLAELERLESFRFMKADFADAAGFGGIFKNFRPDYVVHLGAQANVRYSAQNPAAYVQSNLVGFCNVLEACRAHPPKHCVFASSSSVYGATAKVPFAEDDDTSHPLSFYGATKKSNEVMAHSYAHLFGLNLTGLRFFNVYGPWGRPDTAPTLFAQAICEGRPIDLYAEGRQQRDFTFIGDVVDGVLKTLLYPAAGRSAPSAASLPNPSFRLFNLGHHRPVEVLLFVRMLEQLLGRPAQINLLPPQPADVPATSANLERVNAAIGYVPKTPLEEGLRLFVEWFQGYYGYKK